MKLAVTAALAVACFAAGWGIAAPVAPTAADGSLGMALMAAHVNPTGALVNGVGVISSTRIVAGRYSVIFERSVQNCFFSTATTNSGPGTGATDASIIALYSFTPTQVFVNTSYPTDASMIDSAFSLTVFCPR